MSYFRPNLHHERHVEGKMKMKGVIIYDDMCLPSIEKSKNSCSMSNIRSKTKLINSVDNKLYIRISDGEIH